MEERYWGDLSGLAAVVMWSFTALLISYSGAIPPFLLAAMVFGISFLAYVVMWLRKKAGLSSILRQSGRAYAVCLFGIPGYVALYYTALKTAPLIEANLINYLWPLLIVVFSGMIARARTSCSSCPPSARRSSGGCIPP